MKNGDDMESVFVVGLLAAATMGFFIVALLGCLSGEWAAVAIGIAGIVGCVLFLGGTRP